MSRYVLDTEAFMLYLTGEEGGTVHRLLREAEAGEHDVVMNVYNLAEACVALADRFAPEELDGLLRATEALPIRRVSASDRLLFAAANLRAMHGISAETAIAMATAEQEGATLVTGKPWPAATAPPKEGLPSPLAREAVTLEEMFMGLA
jgi:predicted nucleic acid-binding protein